MSIINFFKKELNGWGNLERVFFPLVILFIISISLYINDNKIALISAICGISYTILAGKGKISCYFFGLCGTLLYAFLSFKNALFGNFLLYACYYFPMEIIGIFRWKKHLNPKQEIVKTKLSAKNRILYAVGTILITVLFAIVLNKVKSTAPIFDSITTVFSVLGMLLTVKRCIEQWYVWIIVNLLSVIMWMQAYINGSNCFATILMWIVYLVLAFYFLYKWNKELKN